MGRSRQMRRICRIVSSSSSSDTDDSPVREIDLRSRSPSKSRASSGSVEQSTEALKEVKRTLPAQRPSTSGYRGDAVPIFDPEEKNQGIGAWCRKIDQFQKVFNWSEDSTIYYALAKLRGLAQTWYTSLPSIDHSWAEWKCMLKTAFPEIDDYADKVEEMMRRKKLPGESFIRYYYEKLALINACENITGRNAVSCIIHGLSDDNMKNSARTRDCSTPEDLFRHLSTLKECKERQIHGKFGRNDNGKGIRYFKRPREETVTSATNSTPPSKRTCFRCGQFGHISTYCQVPQLVCNYCKRKGHDEKQCYAKKKVQQTTNIVS